MFTYMFRSSSRSRIRGVLTSGLLGAALALTPVASPAPAEASPYCGIRWGSLVKTTGWDTTATPISNVRSGQHSCFDRVVVDVAGNVGDYTVRYVDRYRAPGSGQPLALHGGARLEVLVGSPTYDSGGNAVYNPADPTELVNADGYRTLRQLRLGGSFEGQTSIGIGVRARLPMRVFVLDGPGDGERLVIDVAHRW